MRFALYCCELRNAGPKAVGCGLLTALACRPREHEFLAYVPDDPEYLAIRGEKLHITPLQARGGIHNLLMHQQLRQRLIADKAEAVFMMGSRGLTASPCPQAVLVHHPWLLYPKSPAWDKCSVRDRLYRQARNLFLSRGLAHCDVVASQTPVMIERLHRLFQIPYSRLALIPNSITVSAPQTQAESESAKKIREAGHTWRAFFLARFYTHKNHGVLLSVADALLARGRTDIGIFVTVEASHGNGAAQFLKEIQQKGRDKIIHNLGQIPMEHVPSCYQEIHALLLPTLLESFSNTYIDAMREGIPIITSDLDFARTVCGEAARYVDPLNGAAIADALSSLGAEPAAWEERVRLGKARYQTLIMDWDMIADRVTEMLQCAATRQSVRHLLEDPWMREAVELT